MDLAAAGAGKPSDRDKMAAALAGAASGG